MKNDTQEVVELIHRLQQEKQLFNIKKISLDDYNMQRIANYLITEFKIFPYITPIDQEVLSKTFIYWQSNVIDMNTFKNIDFIPVEGPFDTHNEAFVNAIKKALRYILNINNI